jgi:uncharacterized protein YabN with tetrapyrrole methylase and pyrophosphatase domain
VFDGIPDALPALLHATKVQKKAATLAASGLEVDAVAPTPSVGAALEAVADTADEDAVGELLFAVVAVAREAGVDPENALRAASVRHRDEVRRAEQSSQP